MKKVYRVSYIHNGITERTDDFTTMTDNSTESAVKAICEMFNGVWGFNPNGIEIKSIVSGHYEYQPDPRCNLPFFKGNKVFVAD